MDNDITKTTTRIIGELDPEAYRAFTSKRTREGLSVAGGINRAIRLWAADDLKLIEQEAAETAA